MLETPPLIHFNNPYQVVKVLFCRLRTTLVIYFQRAVLDLGRLFLILLFFLLFVLQLLFAPVAQLIYYLLEHLSAPVAVIDVFRVHQRCDYEELFENGVWVEDFYIRYNLFREAEGDVVERKGFSKSTIDISRKLITENYCSEFSHLISLPMI